jgi:hypothetical protein
MARVTSAEVAAIIDYDTTGITDITPFITAANLLVTQVCTDSSLGTDLLKEIERWLAAHFVAVRDPKLTSQSAGGASDSYETNKTGFGLKLTRYGQQAMALDTSGALMAIAEGAKKASMKILAPDDAP